MVLQTERIPNPSRRVYMALDLGDSHWELAIWSKSQKEPSLYRLQGRGHGRKLKKLKKEIDRIRQREGKDIELLSCYEVTWLGYWLDRWLKGWGVDNQIIAANSIERSRKGKHVKTDRVDARNLVRKLKQYDEGDKRAYTTVSVPTLDNEAVRNRQRERGVLQKEVQRVSRRLESNMDYYGIALTRKPKGSKQWKEFIEILKSCRTYNNKEVPETVIEEMGRQVGHLAMFEGDLKIVEKLIVQYHKSLPEDSDARRLEKFKGIGVTVSQQLCTEIMDWSRFSSRKKIGKFLGLTPTLSQSCSTSREQGIGKDGNPRLRKTAVELAWLWRRWQPESDLVLKYKVKLDQKGRIRRMAIVALARELMIALWRYLTQGIMIKGAIFKEVIPSKPRLKSK